MGVPRRWRRIVVAAVWLLALGTDRGGAADPSDPVPVQPGSDLSTFAWADPAEVAALLEELTRGGTIPLAADLERIGWVGAVPMIPRADDDDQAPDPAGRPPRWGGFTALRQNLRDGTGSRPRLLTSLYGPSCRAVVQFERDSSGRTSGAGYAAIMPGRWRLWGGTLGWHHGFGLVCAGPGRWRSLGAAVSLGPGRSGPSGTYATSRRDAILGGHVGWQGGRYSAAILAGSRQDRSDRAERVLWGRIGARAARWNIALLAGRCGAQSGFSLAAAWRHGGAAAAKRFRVVADAELAAWRAESGTDRQRPFVPLWAARVRLSGEKWFCEGQITGSRALTPPAQGARPAVLPQHDGAGWAVRGRWRPAPGMACGALVAASRVRGAYGAVPADRSRTDFAAELEGRPAPGWRVTGAYRWRGTAVVAVSTAEPWAPPLTWQRDARGLVAAHLQRVGEGWTGRVGFRSLTAADGDQPRRRSLCEARLEVVVADGWLVRCGWTTAWGSDVDLIAVATPLPQLSILRHWGRWREEVICGLQVRYRRWLWQAAGSLRRPDPGTSAAAAGSAASRAVQELWLRVTCRW